MTHGGQYRRSELLRNSYAIKDLMNAAADPAAELDSVSDAADTAVGSRKVERDALASAASGNPALQTFASVDAAQNAAVAAANLYAYATRQPPRVDQFVTLVKSRKIPPSRLTRR